MCYKQPTTRYKKKEKRNEKQGKLKTMNIKVFNKKKILFIAKNQKTVCFYDKQAKIKEFLKFVGK